jgi:hypothetical protein
MFLAAGTEVGRSEPAAVRVVDRTLRCTVPLDGGVRQLQFNGQSGVRDQAEPSKWLGVASAYVSLRNASLAGVQAGAPRADYRVPQPEWTFWIRRCGLAAARIDFAFKRLEGGTLNRFSEYYKCALPRRILLRVRAEFRSPVTLRTRAGLQSSAAPVAKGFLAIYSEKEKPLLYADVLESGRARLFDAGVCSRG